MADFAILCKKCLSGKTASDIERNAHKFGIKMFIFYKMTILMTVSKLAITFLFSKSVIVWKVYCKKELSVSCYEKNVRPS